MTFSLKKVMNLRLSGLLRTVGSIGVCRVKNRLIGDFWDFTREAQQTPRKTRGLFFV
jgi:hypothetical protein